MSEVSPDIIVKTQKSLGKYVKKPALTEKLLKKPPFRFLHDVVKAVINETGFLHGLFTEEELISDNVKEKEAKIAFLTKLIDAVKVVSKTDLKVRPSKIVAGLEPTETNILLQTIGRSIDKKIDTKEYVSKLKTSEGKVSKTNKSNERGKEKKTSVTKARENSVSRLKKGGSVETPKSSERIRESSRSRLKDDKKDRSNKSKEKKEERSNRIKEIKHTGDADRLNIEKPAAKTDPVEGIDENNQELVENLNNNVPPDAEEPVSKNIDNIETVIESPEGVDAGKQLPQAPKLDENVMANFSNARQSSAGLVRPKSARPRSGDRTSASRASKETIGPVELNQTTNVNKTSTNVGRPSSSLRPPSVRPSSARPGAPRLRPESALIANEPVVLGNINVIVENFDSGLGDEEDTVVVQNAPEEETDETTDLLNFSGENQGQLVEQILEQIQEGQEDGVRKKVEIDWEQDGLRSKDAATKEVTQLRGLIQSLTKTANPLGKLMNYLHEDLDAMHNELQMWTNTKKQLYMEIEKQKKVAADSSKPLNEKLDNLRQEIRKQEEEILMVRSNILRNEQRIFELLQNK